MQTDTSPVLDMPTSSPETRTVSRRTKIIGVTLAIVAVLALIQGAFVLLAWMQPPAVAETTQSFVVGDVPSVVSTTEAGNLHIVTGGNGQVVVHIKSSVRSFLPALAERALKVITSSVKQTGDSISIHQDMSNDWSPFVVHVANDVTITVPAHTNLTLNHSAGNVDVIGITGEFRLDASAGNITLNGATLMGSSRLHASAGNMIIRGDLATNATLRLDASAGNMTFAGSLTTGNTLDVQASAGNIVLDLPASTSAHISGAVTAGDITLQGFALTVNRQTANASFAGDIGGTSTNTITANLSAGNIAINAN